MLHGLTDQIGRKLDELVLLLSFCYTIVPMFNGIAEFVNLFRIPDRLSNYHSARAGS